MNLNSIIEKFDIKDVEPLEKGWSVDKKFILTNSLDIKYILRVSPIDYHDKRFNQYKLLKELEKLNLNYPKPIDFGYLDNEYVYLLLTYLEGVPAEEKIFDYSDIEQYKLGYNVGQMLKNIHNVSIPDNISTWWDKYQLKANRKIEVYLKSKLKHENHEYLIEYYKDNIELMKNRPQVLCHGDYHLGNMLIHNNEMVVIDFDKISYADPYDEFKPYCWNVIRSEYFETGLINGYFNNHIPDNFFKILKFYTIESLISHLPWAMTFGDEEVKTAYQIYDEVMKWYNNFELEIPTWYKGVLKW